MLTVFTSQRLTLEYDSEFLQLFNSSQNRNHHVQKNVNSFMNWTKCTLRTLYIIMQRNKAQDDLMSNNELTWKTVFMSWIPETNWILLESIAELWASDWTTHHSPLVGQIYRILTICYEISEYLNSPTNHSNCYTRFTNIRELLSMVQITRKCVSDLYHDQGRRDRM